VPEADVPVLDHDVLDEVLESTGNDLDFVKELIDTYLADAPAQLEDMAAAIEADNAASLVRPAHTLKSSSATVGAMRLSAVARELEMAGRSGLLEPSAREMLATARAESAAAAEAIGAWLARASAE
jgi:HPt (histidine-containing phosphotransfer) domain-containing protein